MSQGKNLYKLLSKYWSAYGGAKQVIGSPYFIIAIVATTLFSPVWIYTSQWATDAASMLTGLVGLSLAAFAILLGFSDPDFISKIAGTSAKDHSVYIKVCSTFLHFILMQFSALALVLAVDLGLFEAWLRIMRMEAPALVSKEILTIVQWLAVFMKGMAFLLFSYSLALIAASALAVYRLAIWYDKAVLVSKEPPKKKD